MSVLACALISAFNDVTSDCSVIRGNRPGNTDNIQIT